MDLGTRLLCSAEHFRKDKGRQAAALGTLLLYRLTSYGPGQEAGAYFAGTLVALQFQAPDAVRDHTISPLAVDSTELA